MTTEIPAGYKQTSVGIIPEDWEVKEFKDVLKIFPTASYSRADLSENGSCNYLHYGDIHTKFDFHLSINNNLPKISNEQIKNFELLQSGDLVIADASEDYEGIGKSVEIISTNEESVIAGLHTFMLRDLNNNFAIGYKGYMNSSEIVRKQFYQYATGTKVYSLSKSTLEHIKIPLPPLPEQQKIAEILSIWDKAIDTCQKTIEELKLRNKGLAQQLLSGKTRVKGFENTVWQKEKLKNIGKIPVKQAITEIKDLRTLTVRLYTKGIDFNDSAKTIISISGRPYYQRFKDEILIGRQNIHNGGIGLVKEIHDGHISSNAITSFTINENHSLDFILKFLSNPIVYKKIENYMGGTGQKELSENEWLKVEIQIPEKAEQKRIVEILDTAASELKRYEEKLANLKLQKKGLMQALLTGKVRVK